MPTPKTECTEISVGLGLLGVEPVTVRPEDLERLFQNTLSPKKYAEYVKEYKSNEKDYRRLYSVGVKVQQNHEVLSKVKIESVRWDGQHKQARSVSIARDVTVANIPISIKATSNVVFNLSPHRVFKSLPNGSSSETKSDDWFLALAPLRYQNPKA